MNRKHNPERRAFRGKSYRKGGKFGRCIRILRDMAAQRADARSKES